jgi:hypothetical protein
MMIALMATVALGVLTPDAASARGGGGGGGGHGGGFGGGGFHGGGFGGGGFHGGSGFGGFHGGVAAFHGASGPHFVGGFHPGFHPGFRRHFFIAGGGYVPYGYDDYYGDYGYPDQVYYDGGDGEENSCALVRQRVHTPYGWRYRTVQVCQ